MDQAVIELTRWLRREFAADRRIAIYAGSTGRRWTVGDRVDVVESGATDEWLILEDRYPHSRVHGNTRAHHVARWCPARVHAEVETKWAVLTHAEDALRDDPTDEMAHHLLRVLALPYADQPGYREEWRPS